MNLKQKFLLFLGRAVGAIALSICEAIISSALNLSTFYYLCLKEVLMLFTLIGQYRTYQAVNKLMLPESVYEFKVENFCSFNKDYKTAKNQEYLTVIKQSLAV